MAELLAPSLVHQLSSIVYEADLRFRKAKLRQPGATVARITESVTRDFRDILRANESELADSELSFLTASSGIFQIKLLSGFGFIAEGRGGRQGELMLVTRGTNFQHNRYDMGTNANVGFAVGPRGNIVHRGFLKAFASYRDQLVNFVTDGGRRQNIRIIHCMGHSLGGALANLNASALRSAGHDVYLYTIGAPRVGVAGFAYDTCNIIAPSKICRVLNPCDPVPMVPVFPFMHASKGESEYLVRTSDKIGIEQHLLSSGYARMASLQSWSGFVSPNPIEVGQQGVLESELRKVGGGTMFSGTALRIISNAMLQLLKLIGLVNLSCAQVAFSLTFTAVDLLAEALEKAAHTSVMVTEHVKSVVRGLLGFLGRAFIEVKELSFNFLRWVLTIFAYEMNSRAGLAMERARQA